KGQAHPFAKLVHFLTFPRNCSLVARCNHASSIPRQLQIATSRCPHPALIKRGECHVEETRRQGRGGDRSVEGHRGGNCPATRRPRRGGGGELRVQQGRRRQGGGRHHRPGREGRGGKGRRVEDRRGAGDY